MKVEMSESTFNVIGSLLSSDINVPMKSAGAFATAQAEWARHAEAHNIVAEADVVVEEEEAA